MTRMHFYQPDDVVVYGGIPVRFSTVVRHLDKVAQSVAKQDKKASAVDIREAGIKGFMQSPQHELPDDVRPLTYEEFETVAGLPSGAKMPRAIWEKWITMYPEEVRQRLRGDSAPKRKRKTKSPPRSRQKHRKQGVQMRGMRG